MTGWRYLSLCIVLVEAFLLFREPNSVVLQVLFLTWFGIALVLWAIWIGNHLKQRKKRKRDELPEKPKRWHIGPDGEIVEGDTHIAPPPQPPYPAKCTRRFNSHPDYSAVTRHFPSPRLVDDYESSLEAAEDQYREEVEKAKRDDIPPQPPPNVYLFWK